MIYKGPYIHMNVSVNIIRVYSEGCDLICFYREYCPVPCRLVSHRPTVDLIGAMETQSEPSELELDDVVITNPHIEAILENEDWIEDASYVVTMWNFTV